jgi:hypothetical protein
MTNPTTLITIKEIVVFIKFDPKDFSLTASFYFENKAQSIWPLI